VLKVLCLVMLFLFALQPARDLDLGWHLRYGEYFFQTGQVLKDNLLSFVWPNYHWVQASWGFDLLVYQIFSHWSFWGLSLAGACLATLIFFLLASPLAKLSVLQLLLLELIYLPLGFLLYYQGLRSQTVSAFLFTLTLIVGYSWLGPNRVRIPSERLSLLLLPLLFLVWANLHGGFILGLLVLILAWATHGVLIAVKRRRKLAWKTLPEKSWIFVGLLLLLSLFTPLINPWGLRIYEETVKHATNLNLASTGEWMPLAVGPPEILLPFIIVTLLVLALGILRKESLHLPYLVSFAVVTLLALGAVRFLIPWTIMAVYFLAKYSGKTHLAILRYASVKTLGSLFVVGIIALDLLLTKRFFFLPTERLVHFSWSDYCQPTLCSEALTQKMLADPPPSIGYHPGSMGGYLSWRVPQVKTFIDGRMAAWESNGQTPPVTAQTEPVLNERYPVTFIKFDNQYHFHWAIVPINSNIKAYLDILVKNHLWEQRYEDQIYSYYVKI